MHPNSVFLCLTLLASPLHCSGALRLPVECSTTIHDNPHAEHWFLHSCSNLTCIRLHICSTLSVALFVLLSLVQMTLQELAWCVERKFLLRIGWCEITRSEEKSLWRQSLKDYSRSYTVCVCVFGVREQLAIFQPALTYASRSFLLIGPQGISLTFTSWV